MNAAGTPKYQVVGLNGGPAAGCGRLLPIVRRFEDDRFTVWGAANGEQTWADREQFNQMLAEERWSRFREPLMLPERCRVDAEEFPAQPMIVFAADALFADWEVAGWPTELDGEPLATTRFEQHPGIQAGCITAPTAERLLDDWATHLIGRFDRLYSTVEQPTKLRDLANFILDAARSRDLRYKGYLRLAMTQEPDKVSRTFRSFTSREFSGISLDQFLSKMTELAQRLKARSPVVSPSSTTQRLSEKSGGLGGRGL